MALNALDEFVAAACQELGIPAEDIDTDLILELAREVAHNTIRPAAPVSTYLMGLAVGRGADPAESAARLTALART